MKTLADFIASRQTVNRDDLITLFGAAPLLPLSPLFYVYGGQVFIEATLNSGFTTKVGQMDYFALELGKVETVLWDHYKNSILNLEEIELDLKARKKEAARRFEDEDRYLEHKLNLYDC